MDEQRSEIEPFGPSANPGGAGQAPQQSPASPVELAPGPRRRSRLRLLIWLALIALLVGAVIRYWPHAANQRQTAGRMQSTGPVPVGVATAAKGDVPVDLSGLGTVTPLATVTVKTQINGYLTSVAFQEGQHVTAGQFLAQIDPRPYQVALEQAEGQLGKDQALLKNAQLDLKRYNTLVAQNSIATQTRDTQASLVAQYQATIVSDKAQIDVQKLNLTYCHIVSPVTGRVGLRQVDAGNYVQTSDTNGIVVVTQLQPISVIFTLPEDDLPPVLLRLHQGATLAATAYDRTGTTRLAAGRLETVDNQIDTTTGTVKLRAIFDNADETLFPNQFVNVKLLVRTLQNTVVIPSSAVQRGAPGTFVFLVEPNRTVSVRKVTLGPTNGQRVAVLSGLAAGDEVVDDGADRLKDGAKIMLAGTHTVDRAKDGTAAGQPRHRHGGSQDRRAP